MSKTPNPNRRRIACAGLAGLTLATGLVWRLAPLGLPRFLFKYGGSALWAIMVYWLIAAVLARTQPFELALAACVIAALVELSRLHHSPAEDAFRRTASKIPILRLRPIIFPSIRKSAPPASAIR